MIENKKIVLSSTLSSNLQNSKLTKICLNSPLQN